MNLNFPRFCQWRHGVRVRVAKRARAGLAGHVHVPARNLARSARESDANGLAYSRCPANTNDLARVGG